MHDEISARSKIKVQDSAGTVIDPASESKLEAVRALLAATLDVSGIVAVTNFPATQPVSAASLPLPTDAATQTTLAEIKTKADNLDIALTALRDALRGASDKTLTDLEAQLAAIKTAVEIMDDWDETDRAKVNLIAGQAGVDGNSGVKSAKTVRVVLATDQPSLTNPLDAGSAREATLGKLIATDYLCIKYETTGATSDVDLTGADKNIVWVKVLAWDGANATFSGTGASADVAGSFLRIGTTGKPKIPLWTLTKPDSDVIFEGYVTGRIYLTAPTSAGKNLVLLVGVA